MANYEGNTRTNYFRIKDEAMWSPFFSRLVSTDGDEVSDFSTTDENGIIWHGFGAYGDVVCCPDGIGPDDDFDWNDEDLIRKIQSMLPKREACIILSSGHEKLRYLIGSFTVITSTSCNYGEINHLAANIARSMLLLPGCTKVIGWLHDSRLSRRFRMFWRSKWTTRTQY